MYNKEDGNTTTVNDFLPQQFGGKFVSLLRKKLTPEEERKSKERSEARDIEFQKGLREKQMQWDFAKLTTLSSNDFAEFDFGSFEITEDNRDVFHSCRMWTPTKCNYGLFLSGEAGSGKKHLLRAIIINNYSLMKPFVFIAMPELMTHLKGEEKDFHFKKYARIFGLVIVDFGTEFKSKYDQAEFYRLLSSRSSKNHVTLMSSSYSLEDLAEMYPKHTLSKIKELMAILTFDAKLPHHDPGFKNLSHLRSIQ